MGCAMHSIRTSSGERKPTDLGQDGQDLQDGKDRAIQPVNPVQKRGARSPGEARAHRRGETMPDIYERLGVRRLINARGTHTHLGGTLIRPQVLEAMQAVAGGYVVLDELQDKASEVIARATGA